jgi:hypothetical protein
VSARLRRSRRGGNGKAIALLGVTVAILGALAFFNSWSSRQVVGTDFCEASGPSGLLAIGVDATDVMSDVQKLDVRNRLEASIAALPPNWRIEIWNVAPASGIAVPIASAICKPSTDVSQLTANPAKAKTRGEQFQRLLQEQLSNVLSGVSSKESPILEAIQAVGLRTFGAPGFSAVTQRRLILVSDLLQNTGHLSFIHGLVPYDTFRNSKAFDTTRAPVVGVQIEILLLSRQNGIPASLLIPWWQNLFADLGATITNVQRIVG